MAEGQLEERVIAINRVAKVVKGGRRFSFTALVVVGDGDGNVGLGYGKAKEVPAAIQKGMEEARKNLFPVAARGHHDHAPDHRRARRRPRPAEAGRARYRRDRRRRGASDPRGGRRADVLAKSLGSSNAINVSRATIDGPARLCRPDEVAKLRGKSPEEVSHGRHAARVPRAVSAEDRGHRGRVMAQTLRITQVRSAIGIKPKQRGTLRALGLRRINHTVEHPDRPEIRGMVATVPHLVKVEEIMTIKIHDLNPAPGSRTRGAPRRPRHRRARAARPPAAA